VRRPPGPGAIGAARIAAARGNRPARLAEIAREYGDVVYVRVGPSGFYLLSHPELAHGVLVAHDDRFQRIPGERRYSRWVLGESLFASEGELHARQRALIDPILYGRAPDQHAKEMVEFASGMTSEWRQGETIDVLAHHEEMTTAIMVKVLFGEDGPRGRALARALLDAIEASDAIPLAPTRIPRRVPLPSKRRFRRALAQLHRLIDEAAAASGASTDPSVDVLSQLRAARGPDGRGMSDAQARDEAIGLYRGQKRVAAAGLSWTWHLLGTHPEAERRFHEEVDALGGRPLTYADARRLPYTLMVFREALRIHPPSWILARKSIAPHPVGTYEIPAGATVLVSPWVHHRDARFWKEPEAFRPERFADGVPQLPLGAYFPQGAGPKRCPGLDLLPVEAVMVLATIGQRWRLRPQPGHTVVPWATAFLAPRGGLPMVLERRAGLS